MDQITSALAHHRVAGLDTSVFIYHVEGSSHFADISGSILGLLQDGRLTGVTSLVTMMELLVNPIRSNRLDLVDHYTRMLKIFPNLSLVDIDAPVAHLAAEFRAKYRLRPPDSLQIASCLGAGATAFVTNDVALRRVVEMETIVLADFVT